jgi:hypothetical protein
LVNRCRIDFWSGLGSIETYRKGMWCAECSSSNQLLPAMVAVKALYEEMTIKSFQNGTDNRKDLMALLS